MLILTSIHNWTAIDGYVQDVLRMKKAQKREREDQHSGEDDHMRNCGTRCVQIWQRSEVDGN